MAIDSLPVIFILSLLGSVLAIITLKNPATRAGFVDNAERDEHGRKTHQHVVPPIGGLIIFPMAILIITVSGFDWQLFWPIIAVMGLLLTVGALDDIFHLSSTVKLMTQIGAAIILVYPGDAVLSNMGNLFGAGEVDLGNFAALFSVFCLVLLMNAFNMIDGLDGLSGGVCAVLLSTLAFLAHTTGQGAYLPLILGVLGAVIGFLVFNLRFPWQKTAHIFMGDSGTLTMGAFIGWVAITLYNGSFENNAEDFTPVAAMSLGWLLAFPVMDTFALFALRLSQKRSPFSPDRFHFHYILRDSGFHVSSVSAMIHVIHIIYAGIALAVLSFPPSHQWMAFYPWLALLAIHTFIVFKARQAESFLYLLFQPRKNK